MTDHLKPFTLEERAKHLTMNIKIKPIHKYTWIGMILIIVGLVSFSNYPYIGNGVIFIGAIMVSVAIFTGKNVVDK